MRGNEEDTLLNSDFKKPKAAYDAVDLNRSL